MKWLQQKPEVLSGINTTSAICATERRERVDDEDRRLYIAESSVWFRSNRLDDAAKDKKKGLWPWCWCLCACWQRSIHAKNALFLKIKLLHKHHSCLTVSNFLSKPEHPCVSWGWGASQEQPHCQYTVTVDDSLSTTNTFPLRNYSVLLCVEELEQVSFQSCSAPCCVEPI